MKFWHIPGRWKTDGIRLIGGDQTHCKETTWKKWIDPEKPRTEGKYSSRRESHPQSQAANATLWRHGAPGLKNALGLEKKQRRAWSNFWESEEENRNAALLGRQRPWISHWMNEHPVDGDRVGRKAGKSQPAPHPPASAHLPHTSHPYGESNCPGALLTKEPASIPPTPWWGLWSIRPTEPTEPPASCPLCPESSSHKRKLTRCSLDTWQKLKTQKNKDQDEPKRNKNNLENRKNWT